MSDNINKFIRSKKAINLIDQALNGFYEDDRIKISPKIHALAIKNSIRLRNMYDVCLESGDDENAPHVKKLIETADFIDKFIEDNLEIFIKSGENFSYSHASSHKQINTKDIESNSQVSHD